MPETDHPRRGTDTDAVIDGLAAGQHGVVARRQLLEMGVPERAIDYRIGKGRLHRLYRGVYRVGPVRGRREREMAAVLACGAGAVLSHRSAAVVWGMVPARRRSAPVEVCIRRGYRAPGPKLRVHRVAIPAEEATTVEGVPVTVPARTVLDLAASCEERELEQALAQGERRGLVDRRQIAALVDRYPRRAGTRLLRKLLADDGRASFTRSEAESRFLSLVRKAQLEPPETNVRLGGYEVDFLWRAARLVVEVDGYAYHSSPGAFDRDRRRDAVLTASGFRVLRVTWRQLVREPEALLVRLGQALGRP